ncbi:hypothetical protein [Nitrososphaera sp.]|nr:hypothetical protein [Nitrososphaera sp.]
MFNCPNCGMKLQVMESEDRSWCKCIYCKEYFQLPQLKMLILRE